MINKSTKTAMVTHLYGIQEMQSNLENMIQDLETQFNQADISHKISILGDLAEIDTSGRILCRFLTMINNVDEINWFTEDIVKVAAIGYVNIRKDCTTHRENVSNDEDTYSSVGRVLCSYLVNHEDGSMDDLVGLFRHADHKEILNDAAIGRLNKTWWVTEDERVRTSTDE